MPIFLFANIGKEQDTPREGCLHVSHFRSCFLTTKTDNVSVLNVNQQLQGSSTFEFYWAPQKATFTDNWSLAKVSIRGTPQNPIIIQLLYDRRAYLYECPYIYLEILNKWQEIASCDINLEVSEHMYPGSGLQTGIGCSYTGLKFYPPQPIILRQFRCYALMLFLGIFFVICWCSFFYRVSL